jgi:hypothetical protein
LLVRWDVNGNLLGAHVQWSNVVINDDGSKQIYPTTVEPVALTKEGKGFPIADVLNEAQHGDGAADRSCGSNGRSRRSS